MPRTSTASQRAGELSLDEQTFASKTDALLALVIAAAAVAAITAPGRVFSVAPSSSFIGIVVASVTVVLPLWIFTSTRYTLTAGELRVQSGPFRRVVPLAEVRAVRTSRNPLSSPALSLDRLEIHYGRGQSIMISPAEKDAWMAAFNARRVAAVSRGLERAVSDEVPAVRAAPAGRSAHR